MTILLVIIWVILLAALIGVGIRSAHDRIDRIEQMLDIEKEKKS